MQNFRRYLRTLGNCKNTIKKTLKNLRVYINIALRKKFLLEDPYIDIRMPTIVPDMLFLTPDELQKMVAINKTFLMIIVKKSSNGIFSVVQQA